MESLNANVNNNVLIKHTASEVTQNYVEFWI